MSISLVRDGGLTNDERTPLVICDVLYLCGHNTTRLLEDNLIVPLGVQFLEVVCNPIVFPKQQIVDHRQT